LGRQVNFNIAIIGCGLIGEKRSKSLGKKGKLIACADIDINKAKKIATNNKKIKVFYDWKKLLKIKEIDIVIISTFHNELSKILLEAYKRKKHIFVEKPAAKNFNEIKKVISKIKGHKIKIRVGYNHRYHPSIILSNKLIKSGAIGKLMYIRARYGHGGRLNYQNEWRAKKSISGGGELLDQGSHLIDLSSSILGKFNKVSGFIKNFFWRMPVEDNSFLILRTSDNKVAFLHASWTEWKNIFSFEIFGTKGKLNIYGKGGSYGTEQLTFYKMSKKMEKPSEKKWIFKNKDISWKLEMDEFYNDIIYKRKPNISLSEAYETLKIIDKIYKK